MSNKHSQYTNTFQNIACLETDKFFIFTFLEGQEQQYGKYQIKYFHNINISYNYKLLPYIPYKHSFLY